MLLISEMLVFIPVCLFCKGNEWLVVKGETPGCAVCSEVDELGMSPQTGAEVEPSKE